MFLGNFTTKDKLQKKINQDEEEKKKKIINIKKIIIENKRHNQTGELFFINFDSFINDKIKLIKLKLFIQIIHIEKEKIKINNYDDDDDDNNEQIKSNKIDYNKLFTITGYKLIYGIKDVEIFNINFEVMNKAYIDLEKLIQYDEISLTENNNFVEFDIECKIKELKFDQQLLLLLYNTNNNFVLMFNYKIIIN